MRVTVDFRPQYLIESRKRKVNIPRMLFFILSLSFIIMGTTTCIWSYLHVSSLKEKDEKVRETLVAARMQDEKMDAELKRLAGMESFYLSSLSVLQKELPALEFLEAVERGLPSQVWIRRISVASGKATMDGSAYTEESIVEFAKGLLKYPVVALVDFPVTSRVIRNEKSMIDFSLTCHLGNFASIIDGGK